MCCLSKLAQIVCFQTLHIPQRIPHIDGYVPQSEASRNIFHQQVVDTNRFGGPQRRLDVSLKARSHHDAQSIREFVCTFRQNFEGIGPILHTANLVKCVDYNYGVADDRKIHGWDSNKMLILLSADLCPSSSSVISYCGNE